MSRLAARQNPHPAASQRVQGRGASQASSANGEQLACADVRRRTSIASSDLRGSSGAPRSAPDPTSKEPAAAAATTAESTESAAPAEATGEAVRAAAKPVIAAAARLRFTIGPRRVTRCTRPAGSHSKTNDRRAFGRDWRILATSASPRADDTTWLRANGHHPQGAGGDRRARRRALAPDNQSDGFPRELIRPGARYVRFRSASAARSAPCATASPFSRRWAPRARRTS